MKMLRRLGRALGWQLMPPTARLERIEEALGRIEFRLNCLAGAETIEAHEFPVHSQWGEDGIIQFLVSKIPIENCIFVEFGVEDYRESNTRFLLKNNNWAGLVIDASERNIAAIKSDDLFWRYNLKAECAFVDRDNINDLITRNGIRGDIGLLSIDVDGNDFWLWDAIESISPRIVICEYNSLFGRYKKVTTPYDPRFDRMRAHYSGIYFGASLSALHALGIKKGYSLVGCTSAGNDAFFVRNDVLNDLTTRTPRQAYVRANFRQARDREGNLLFIGQDEELDLIGELRVVDVESHQFIKVRDLGRDK